MFSGTLLARVLHLDQWEPLPRVTCACAFGQYTMATLYVRRNNRFFYRRCPCAPRHRDSPDVLLWSSTRRRVSSAVINYVPFQWHSNSNTVAVINCSFVLFRPPSPDGRSNESWTCAQQLNIVAESFGFCKRFVSNVHDVTRIVDWGKPHLPPVHVVNTRRSKRILRDQRWRL
jgi:hypothetical protein